MYWAEENDKDSKDVDLPNNMRSNNDTHGGIEDIDVVVIGIVVLVEIETEISLHLVELELACVSK